MTGRVWVRGLAPDGARVERLNLIVERLPKGLSGARILFVTDVHAGFTFPDAAVDGLIEQLEGLAPDMILWGGDFAETRVHAARLFEKIARLRPPMGMAGVVGNNDRRAFKGSIHAFEEMALEAGVRILINGRWTLPVDGGALTILGLDEDYLGSPDASILAGSRREGEMEILLSHSPAPLERLLRGTRPAQLILCGHTHGGQVRLMGRTLYDFGFDGVRPAQRFFTVRGVRREEGATVVVSGGLGSSRIPLRINCPPEIQLIMLSGAQSKP